MKPLSVSQECALRHLIENPFDTDDKNHLFSMTKPTNTLKSLVQRGLVSYDDAGGRSGSGQYALTKDGQILAKSLFAVMSDA